MHLRSRRTSFASLAGSPKSSLRQEAPPTRQGLQKFVHLPVGYLHHHQHSFCELAPLQSVSVMTSLLSHAKRFVPFPLLPAHPWGGCAGRRRQVGRIRAHTDQVLGPKPRQLESLRFSSSLFLVTNGGATFTGLSASGPLGGLGNMIFVLGAHRKCGRSQPGTQKATCCRVFVCSHTSTRSV